MGIFANLPVNFKGYGILIAPPPPYTSLNIVDVWADACPIYHRSLKLTSIASKPKLAMSLRTMSFSVLGFFLLILARSNYDHYARDLEVILYKDRTSSSCACMRALNVHFDLGLSIDKSIVTRSLNSFFFSFFRFCNTPSRGLRAG